ncbi:hypothetical protein F5148DRAFT_1149492 [Russula earlei]|uniref:Uncharacterized protein n=1 Tax=Russula earlei TaxID=71964 RepID=A0ACC0U873_9AGAM|nr:hypothetical protein F5148DRAFT_1149492 [Russula earlei]
MAVWRHGGGHPVSEKKKAAWTWKTWLAQCKVKEWKKRKAKKSRTGKEWKNARMHAWGKEGQMERSRWEEGGEEGVRRREGRKEEKTIGKKHGHWPGAWVIGQGHMRDLKAEAPFGSVGQLEQRGGERNAVCLGTGMYRSWRGKEKNQNHIEMKTKKRMRSWPLRGCHIHGRVVMVATAGEWVPVGGRALL